MSASNSKSSSSPVTTTTDRRVAADGGAVVLGDGARLETLADDVALAAIDKAQESAVTSAQLAKDLNASSLDFAKSVTSDNFKMTGKTLDTVGELSGDNAQLAEVLATLAVNNVTRTANPTLATSDSLITAGAVVLGLGVIAYALKK